MRRRSTLLFVLLSTITAVAVAVAWQQYTRAEALSAQLRQAEMRAAEAAAVAEVTPRAPADTGTAEADVGEDAAASGEEPASQERRSGRERGGGFVALLANPEFAAAWQQQQKSRLDERYAALFRKLNLGPAEIDQLKTLLAERQTVRMEVMAAAREAGFTGREHGPQLRQLMEQADAEIETNLRQLLGESGYNEYQTYEQTAPQRGVVNQLSARLSYSGAPLTTAQNDALVALLAEAGPGTAPPETGNGRGGQREVPLISEAALVRAQAFLAPAQWETLKTLQQEQAAQLQMQEMMRQEFARDRARPTRPDGAPAN